MLSCTRLQASSSANQTDCWMYWHGLAASHTSFGRLLSTASCTWFTAWSLSSKMENGLWVTKSTRSRRCSPARTSLSNRKCVKSVKISSSLCLSPSFCWFLEANFSYQPGFSSSQTQFHRSLWVMKSVKRSLFRWKRYRKMLPRSSCISSLTTWPKSKTVLKSMRYTKAKFRSWRIC